MTTPRADAAGASGEARPSGAAYPLPGYVRRVLPGAELVVQDGLQSAMTEVLARHGTLYGWARNEPQREALRGRAPVYVATLATAPVTTVVVRHSWHGGVFAPLTGDRFLRPTRAPRELLHSFMLQQCSIPTPEFVAFAMYRAGPLMARVDVATRYVPHAHDLRAVLAGFAAGVARSAAFDAVERLLVQLAASGFTHPDLNVKNVLLYHEPRGLVAAVLDVDVVRWSASEAPSTVMLANVSRLLRSLRKLRRRDDITVSDGELHELAARLLAAIPARMQAPDVRIPAGRRGA